MERALSLRRALRRLRRVRGDLPRRQPAGDRDAASTPTTAQRFAFDPRVIDWTHYIRDIHLPSVVEHARVKTTPGKSRTETRADAPAGARCCRPSATWPPSTSRTRSSPRTSSRATRGWPPAGCRVDDRLRFVGRTLKEAPTLLALDRTDRGDFLRYFYRRYEGAPVDQIDDDAAELFSALILTKSFPAGIRRVREHKRARPPHGADHRRARLRGGAAAAAVRRDHRRRDGGQARRHLHRRAHRRAAHRRDAGPAPGRLLRRRGPRPGRERRLRRLARPTCPCSRRSASRWP